MRIRPFDIAIPSALTFSRMPRMLTWFLSRMRNRADSEHEMTINRLAVSGAAYAYILIAAQFEDSGAIDMVRAEGPYFILYQILALLLFCHLVYQPSISVSRRLIGLIMDLGIFSYGMHAGGETFAPLYPFYLWVIFGNGFRFGVPYLYAGLVISVITFGTVVATTPFWLNHFQLGLGLIAGLIFLPLYVSTLIRKLSKAKHQAEAANRAKSVFLASMSHEFRTPLNAIVGLSDLLHGASNDPEQEGMLEMIGQSGRRLLSLVNSVLDLSRVEAGRMSIKSVNFDPVSILTEVKNLLTVEAQRKSIKLSVYYAARTPDFVVGDKGHLEEILSNLVSNAVKFTQQGYIVIAVDAIAQDGDVTRLRFEVTDTGIGIAPDAQTRIFELFSQADETIIDRFGGTGLGLAIVKKLVELQGGTVGVDSVPGRGSSFWFEIPYRIQDRTLPHRYTGAAPVLVIGGNEEFRALVKSCVPGANFAEDAEAGAAALAELKTNGSRRPIVLIDQESYGALDGWALNRESDKGSVGNPSLILLMETDDIGLPAEEMRSRFVTTVPISANSSELMSALRIGGVLECEKRAFEIRPMRTKRSLSILIADDNRTNQHVVAKILERAGHQSMIVEDGQAALDALGANEFDLVLMDVNMPVMNGIEATKLYRFGALGRKHVPIVAFTADATEEAGRRCKEAGMDAWLVKPIEPNRLIETIEVLVHGAEGSESIAKASNVANHDLACSSKRGGKLPAVDESMLRALEDLGGKRFVDELATEFIHDVDEMMKKLKAIVASGDVMAFREQLHALRSAAANLGARGIFELCLKWRLIASEDLAKRGEAHLSELGREVERVRAELQTRLMESNAAA